MLLECFVFSGKKKEKRQAKKNIPALTEKKPEIWWNWLKKSAQSVFFLFGWFF